MIKREREVHRIRKKEEYKFRMRDREKNPHRQTDTKIGKNGNIIFI